MPQLVKVAGTEVTTLAAALKAGFFGWSPVSSADAPAAAAKGGRSAAEAQHATDQVKQYSRG